MKILKTKKQIKKFLKDAANGLIGNENGSVWYLKIPIDTENDLYCPDLKIVVCYEPGFDTAEAETNQYQDGEYCVCASVRIDDNNYFNDDCYRIAEDYPFDNSDEENDFDEVTKALYKDIQDYVEMQLWEDNQRIAKDNGHPLCVCYWTDHEEGFMYDAKDCKFIERKDSYLNFDRDLFERKITEYVKANGKKGAEDCELYIDINPVHIVVDDGGFSDSWEITDAHQICYFSESDETLVYWLDDENGGHWMNLSDLYDSDVEDIFHAIFG